MVDAIPAVLPTSRPGPLLIAVPARFERRCRCSDLNVAGLTQRAARSLAFSPCEREICQNRADELETQC